MASVLGDMWPGGPPVEPAAQPAVQAARLECPGPWSNACSHNVQFYADDCFLIDELAQFVGPALKRGDAAVVIATAPHREALRRACADRGIDLGAAASEGRWVAADAVTTLSSLMVDEEPSRERFFDIVGSIMSAAKAAGKGPERRPAVFGEMVALLWAKGNFQATLALEQLWNELLQAQAFELHCAYPMSAFSDSSDDERLMQVCAQHSRVVPAECYTMLRTEDERLRRIAFLQQKAQALQHEIARRQALERDLRQAIEARDVFLSIAAHELNTPLTSLRGFAHLLSKAVREAGDVPRGRLEAWAQTVEVQSRKLGHLISRLLDATQLEEGQFGIRRRETDLSLLVRTAIAQYPEPRRRIVYVGPEHVLVSLDALRFEQVLTNLLSNAVKFSPADSLITVKLGERADGSTYLSVTDQGIGIAPDQRDAVFQRFYHMRERGHRSGLGLGLYVTRHIVQLHGGSIHVEAPGPRGSRFVVTLPRQPAPIASPT